ncbi:MAG: hypothetical protein QW794_07860 [Thermosphaera sp.]
MSSNPQESQQQKLHIVLYKPLTKCSDNYAFTIPKYMWPMFEGKKGKMFKITIEEL